MTITLQDEEVIIGMPIGDEAMVRCTNKELCHQMLGFEIPYVQQTMLDGQNYSNKSTHQLN